MIMDGGQCENTIQPGPLTIDLTVIQQCLADAVTDCFCDCCCQCCYGGICDPQEGVYNSEGGVDEFLLDELPPTPTCWTTGSICLTNDTYTGDGTIDHRDGTTIVFSNPISWTPSKPYNMTRLTISAGPCNSPFAPPIPRGSFQPPPREILQSTLYVKRKGVIGINRAKLAEYLLRSKRI